MKSKICWMVLIKKINKKNKFYKKVVGKSIYPSIVSYIMA